MTDHTIQVNYEFIEAIAGRFQEAAIGIERMQQSLRDNIGELEHGGWEGEAAHAFFAEMNDDIFPALKRLSKAIETAYHVVEKIHQMLKQAEESTAYATVANPTEGTSPPQYTKAEGESFTYKVTGIVPNIEQKTNMVCWATVATMMLSWRDQRSYTFEEAMNLAGPFFFHKFMNNKGLGGSEKEAFLNNLGLKGEPPMNYSVSGLRSLLENHGPLWVTTDENPTANFSIHARVITGMYGDGSVDGTYLAINDPGDGKQHVETFRTFANKFEEVTNTGDLRIQVVHF